MDKICFFSGDITRDGGTEKASSMIANALAKQGNYQVLFLSLVEQAGEPFFPLEDGIGRYSLGDKWINPGPGYLKLIPRLRRFIKQHDINIIIDIDIVLDILSIPAARGLGTKIISWEHFNYIFEKKTLYRRYILKYSVKRTDYIVTLTEGDKRMYMDNQNRREAISAIYNPVGEFDFAEDAEKEKWLISVGHLAPVKGVDYLAEVAAMVLKKYPDWKWMVVGDGEQKEFLETFIEQNQLGEQLVLTGRVKDVSAYLNKAQIYVMTSRSEGLPLCLLEAMAFRLPSVSFDIATGPNEIIEEGVNGYLVKAYDCEEMAQKLERLMEDPELRKQFSEHAQDNMAKFQMDSILEKWNAVFKALLN